METIQMFCKFSITIILDDLEQICKFDRQENCVYIYVYVYISTHCIKNIASKCTLSDKFNVYRI